MIGKRIKDRLSEKQERIPMEKWTISIPGVTGNGREEVHRQRKFTNNDVRMLRC